MKKIFLEKISRNKDILVLIIIFILIRSLNFESFYSFANDQSLLTFRAFRSFYEDRFTLIGPFIGLGAIGRNLILPSTTYYLIVFFTQLTNGNALMGSYLFMIFGAFSMVFLYRGVKILANTNSARLICVIYSLAPYYIFYSRDNFNPNFFLFFTPYLVYAYAKSIQNGDKKWYFLLGAIIGFLSQLHTQIGLIYIFVILATPYFFKKHRWNFIFIYIGLQIGLLPYWLIEIKNNFYNLSTLILSLHTPTKDVAVNTTLSQVDYIYTGVSLFFMSILITFIKKFVNSRIIFLVGLVLAVWSFSKYYPKPTHPQGISHDWFYYDNQKVAQIISEKKLKNYNVTLPFHQNTGESVKFFLIQMGEKIKWDDYYTNEYLYVVTDGSEYTQYKTYEVNDFRPSRVIETWDLKNKYQMLLLQRQIAQ